MKRTYEKYLCIDKLKLNNGKLKIYKRKSKINCITLRFENTDASYLAEYYTSNYNANILIKVLSGKVITLDSKGEIIYSLNKDIILIIK